MTNSATSEGVANITRFAVDPSGTLTPVDSVPAAHGARGMAITEDRRFAYVSSPLADEIGIYRIARDGALTRIGAQPVTFPVGVLVNPHRNILYVTSLTGGTLSAFTIGSNGTLRLRGTADTGAPDAKAMAITPDGRFLYISHGLPEDTTPSLLTGYAIGPDGLPHEQVTATTVGISGAETVITPDGRYVYVACQGSDEFFGFRVNPDGGLTPVVTQPVGQGQEDAAISPDGTWLYVAAPSVEGTGAVLGFRIATDGSLTPAGDPVPMPTPAGIAFGPDGRHLYVTDFDTSTITTFAIAGTGQLTAIQTIPSGGPQPAFQSVTLLPI